MTETKIYIGLNDAHTLTQRFETEKYIDVLKEMEGGYLHEDGQYTQENTLVLSIIDVEKEIIQEIAKDLCVFFHQESVMITQSSAEMYYIKALT